MKLEENGQSDILFGPENRTEAGDDAPGPRLMKKKRCKQKIQKRTAMVQRPLDSRRPERSDHERRVKHNVESGSELEQCDPPLDSLGFTCQQK